MHIQKRVDLFSKKHSLSRSTKKGTIDDFRRLGSSNIRIRFESGFGFSTDDIIDLKGLDIGDE
jgi:hypothetical protein